MVKGDHLSHIDQILLPFGFSEIGSFKDMSSWDEALKAGNPYGCPRDVSPKIVTVCDGWTVILDLEATMWTDSTACETVSTESGQPLFSMVCNGTVGSYAFGYYANGQARRSWFDFERGFLQNEGNILPEEAGVGTERKLSEDDILSIMKRLGVDYGELEQVGRYHVCYLVYPPVAVVAQPSNNQQVKKTWWKLW